MNLSQTNISSLNAPLNTQLTADELYVEQMGKTVARSLDKELSYLSPKVLQSLDKARNLALSQHKVAHISPLRLIANKLNFLPSLGPLSPIVLALLLVFGIAQWQQNARINNIADVDAAILTDSVPPDAYIDDGFKLFLKKMLHAAEAEKSNVVTDSTMSKDQNPASTPEQASSEPSTGRVADISTNQ